MCIPQLKLPILDTLLAYAKNKTRVTDILMAVIDQLHNLQSVWLVL